MKPLICFFASLLGVLGQVARAQVQVASGDVTADSIVLLARPTVPGDVTFRWSVLGRPPDRGAVVVFGSALVPAKATIIGLTPHTAYFYEATDAAGVRAAGRFNTPARRGRHGLRFGVTGDYRGELGPFPAIANLPERGVDFLVTLGDTIYADFPSPAVPKPQCETLEDFRVKHAEEYAPRFGLSSLADGQASTVWFATIDDHEVTDDFAGAAAPDSDEHFAGQPGAFISETPLFRDGLQAFHEHHPIQEEIYGDDEEPRFAGKPRLYRYRRFGDDAAFMLTDARTFRDEPLPPFEGFRVAAFTPGRTLLGRRQLEELKADLLRSERDGVTWKFVMIPEPTQNLGPILGTDRYEGFAAERTELLSFIRAHGLRNVVFVTADIHCTIVNNLSYQEFPGGPQIPVDAWEISTGAVAFAPPFGPLAVEILRQVPLIGPLFGNFYDSLTRQEQDHLLTAILDRLLRHWGYEAIGLEDAELLEGAWISLNTFGWTEFEIRSEDQMLTVTTYGVDWYDRAELLEDPDSVLARRPEIVSRFAVEAAPVARPCDADLNGDGLVDTQDLAEVLAGIGHDAGDVTGDGLTDLSDVTATLAALGAPCAD